MGYFMNVRSLTDEKFFEIKQFVLERKLDFMAVCESWLHKNSPFHLFEIENYNLWLNCREGARGGGCLIWTAKSLKAEVLAGYMVTAKGSEYEHLILKVSTFIIFVFYNPPGANVGELMQHWDDVLLNECSSELVPIIIGDINADLGDRQMSSYLQSRNLRNFQSDATRSGHVLDICVSFCNSQIQSCAEYELALSDHLPICVKINRPANVNRGGISFSYSRDYSNFDFVTFNGALMVEDWTDFHNALLSNDVDLANEKFCSKIMRIFNEIVPVVIKRKKFGTYLPLELRKWMKERNRLLKLTYVHPQDVELRADFQRIRNFVKSMRRAFEKDNADRKFEHISDDPRKLWNELNRLMGRKTKPMTCDVSAEDFNNYFATAKDWCDPTPVPLVFKNGSDEFDELSYDDIFSAIARVKGSKAPGLDGVTNKMLKLGKGSLAPKLRELFNCVIVTGEFPKAWKKAKIVTIYKKSGNTKDPANYRPISLLSAIAKLFEVCIFRQIYPMIEPRLPKCQHAFRKGHSIVTALVEITDYIYSQMEMQKLAYVLQIDIKKAYDTVNPYLLMQKIINDLNLSRTALKLLEGYLIGRRIITQANDRMSTEKTVDIGVPQGGVLSPIFFIFFLSEIELLPLVGRLILYADDAQVLYSCSPADESSVERQMNEDIAKIELFLRSLQMQINVRKTTVSRFGSRLQLAKVDPDGVFEIACCKIKIERGVRNLGLFLDEQLSFEAHFVNISRGCMRTLYHLRAIRPYISEKNSKLLVESLVISKIRLFLPITMTSSSKSIQIIQKIVNCAIRVIHQLRKFDRLTEYRSKYKWGNVLGMAQCEFESLVKKVETESLSFYLNNLLVQNASQRTRRRFYRCEIAKTKSGERCFKNRATYFLNHL
ncbi:MAG: reverse transcriptase family protein [Christensenellaceae bacterium]